MKRVVVTGVGLTCPVGIGTEPSWQALLAGKGGIQRITHFDAAEFACQIAGEVDGFDPLNYVDKRDLRKMGRFIFFVIDLVIIVLVVIVLTRGVTGEETMLDDQELYVWKFWIVRITNKCRPQERNNNLKLLCTVISFGINSNERLEFFQQILQCEFCLMCKGFPRN